jgi:hypothetical protein
MEIQKGFREVERIIAEGRQHWWGQGHMQQLYDAQTKGFEKAKVDAGKAIRLGTDVIQFMRNQLQMMDCSSAWSTQQSSFEQAMSMRVGYKAAYDAVEKLLVQERLRPRVERRERPDRPRNDRSL